MAKTRDIRKRIISVRNIHKITRTMERVAQSKGMKLTNRYEAARSFRAHVLRLLPEALGTAPGSLEASQELAAQPLGAQRPEIRRVLLFCVTSSRGLCGGYNTRVIQAARARMQELRQAGKEPALAVMGRKGLAFFRFHNQPVAIAVADADENIPFRRLDEVVQQINERFIAKEFDAVQIISTRYKTKAIQEVRAAALLPFTADVVSAKPAGPLPAAAAPAGPTPGPDGTPLYLVEPDRARVLLSLVPLLVKVELFCTVLEAMLCEQTQRSVAMRSASDNAESMTKRLTRTYNRVRQAQITNEMIEIISGSEGGRT
ncbi:MAG: ATP synthase F1 subunit gamma [Spirochaetia bacterium]|jgi:F-type H+-transporting ATPase subunit gamma